VARSLLAITAMKTITILAFSLLLGLVGCEQQREDMGAGEEVEGFGTTDEQEGMEPVEPVEQQNQPQGEQVQPQGLDEPRQDFQQGTEGTETE
jgi:hypothetical protein